MAWIAWLLVALVAILHIVFMAAEMFRWTKVAEKLAAVAEATIPLGKTKACTTAFWLRG